MTMVVRVAKNASMKEILHPSLFLMSVMIPTVSVLMITHTLEVIVLSLAYSMVDAAPPDAMSFIFRSSTTRHLDMAILSLWRAGGCWAR
jgi:hypothetical protein